MKLTDTEYLTLSKLRREPIDDIEHLPESEQRTIRLLSRNECVLLLGDFVGGVTAEGHHAMEEYEMEREQTRRVAIRYWITTAIAVIALIVSVIALMHTLGWLTRLPVPPA